MRRIIVMAATIAFGTFAAAAPAGAEAAPNAVAAVVHDDLVGPTGMCQYGPTGQEAEVGRASIRTAHARDDDLFTPVIVRVQFRASPSTTYTVYLADVTVNEFGQATGCAVGAVGTVTTNDAGIGRFTGEASVATGDQWLQVAVGAGTTLDLASAYATDVVFTTAG
jgi:hypothetical protein